ncbi:hypothetical protein [Brevundimonas sp. FT23028]|uniref:COG4648 family protein n=1 Tax=Brevundimonas sp. FT23028 TaxID=3393748 RepID=UPI003B58A24D
MPKVDVPAVLLVGTSVLYPVVAAIAVRTVGPGWVVGGLLVFLLLRALTDRARRTPGALTWGLLAAAAGLLLVALFDRELSVRLYPAFMNAAMFLAFGQTLLRGPSMIERFARLTDPDLPASGVVYTRIVTLVWTGFFAVNGLIAVWTALWADWKTWTLYNAGVAYGLIGVLIVGELLVRPFARRAMEAR